VPAELKSRYERNLFESVIPFWEKYSLDSERGGQFTCLTREGRVYDSRKYVWMNGRAVWTFSKLYNTVEKKEPWRAAAAGILDFLLQHARDPQGRCYFSLTREGKPVFFQRKPYSTFFLFLALAEYYKTGAAPESYRTEAIRIFSQVNEWIADATLLGRPSFEGQRSIRQLADIMVIASMALELLEIDPSETWRQILRDSIEQARAHWLPEKRTLLENLPLDGSHYADSPDTRLLCPGSAIEVAWFLLHAAEALADETANDFLYDVVEGSLELGWDARHGGLYYFMDSAGLPPLQLEANMKLWWPHTEAIYATALAYSKTKDPKWLKWWKRVDEYAFRTFVDWQYGEWYGYCDRQGHPTHQLKGGPYKGFFHVPRCLLFTSLRF
jgi:N-acylglucosamine 2-epimerase